jgi:hypothetical protein
VRALRGSPLVDNWQLEPKPISTTTGSAYASTDPAGVPQSALARAAALSNPAGSALSSWRQVTCRKA